EHRPQSPLQPQPPVVNHRRHPHPGASTLKTLIDHPLITACRHGQSLRARWHAAQNSPERIHKVKRCKSGVPLRQSLLAAVLALPFILAAVIVGSPSAEWRTTRRPAR
ncbi:hypothetical protein ABT404_52170, partial [Streptomyces hyaluromycini]